jgi:signal transduction histidine kinase
MTVVAGDPTAEAARLRRLLTVGRSLTPELDLDLVLTDVLETARELTGAGHAALGVLDDERRGLSQFHTAGDAPRPREPAHPPAGNVLDTPIVIRGDVCGNLHLAEKRGAADFDDDDLDVVVVLAGWAAIAIDSARLLGTSERRRQEHEHAVAATEATMDVALALGAETELAPILELIVARARTLVEADALLIWLVDGDELRLAASAGNATPLTDVVMPVATSTAGRTLRDGEPLRLADARRGLSVDPARFGLASVRGALIVPLIFRGHGLGVLTAFDRAGGDGTFSADDERALRAFAASAATAVATARTVERQRLRDTLAAAEAERRRWARDLHDGPLQGLSALLMLLSRMRRTEPQHRDAILDETVSQLEHEITGLREVISDLRPAALDQLGLQAALRTLAERFTAANGLECTLELQLGERRLETEIETLAYRIVQEALTNVGKHAQAHAVRVALTPEHACLVLQVDDDGCGIPDASLRRPGGFGLTGMAERAELAGGSLDVRRHPRGGTRVTLIIPNG